jgi:HEAT repeat protein
MDSISELVRKLGHSDDYFERQKAAWALVKIGDEAIDALVEALINGEFSDLRYKAAWALGKIGNSRAVEPLGKTMQNDSDYVVREWCAAALEAVGDAGAAPYLVRTMQKDSSKDVRLRASVALRNLGAAEALMELLKAPEPETRGMAVTGLARLKCEAALGGVVCLLTDDDVEVRRRCVAFMGEVTSQQVTDSLVMESLERALKDLEATVRTEALKSLGKVRGEQACSLALDALKDEDSGVRLAAVTSLGDIGNVAALDPLVEVMFSHDEEEIRAWAAWSLGELGNARAVEHLMKAYRTCPMDVMKKAKASLEEIFGVKV